MAEPATRKKPSMPSVPKIRRMRQLRAAGLSYLDIHRVMTLDYGNAPCAKTIAVYAPGPRGEA